MDNQSEPVITVRLSFLVKFLLLRGYKDRVTLGPDNEDYKKLISDIKAVAPESLCHIQDHDGLTTIWNPADWAVDIQRHEIQKANADERVYKYNRSQEIKEELKKLIVLKMGNIGIENALADNIINKKIVVMVQQLGGSAELCEKISQL